MIQRRSPQFVLASLAATASIMGSFAVSMVTRSHAQVATPRFTASSPAPQAQLVHQGSSVVISQ